VEEKNIGNKPSYSKNCYLCFLKKNVGNVGPKIKKKKIQKIKLKKFFKGFFKFFNGYQQTHTNSPSHFLKTKPHKTLQITPHHFTHTNKIK